MAYYLVHQRTEKGMEEARRKQEEKHENDPRVRHPFYFDRKVWAQVGKVTPTLFEEPEGVRAYYRANQSGFCGGLNAPEWIAWLNGEDSTDTLHPDGTFRFWFMDCDEFNALEEKQRKELGLLR